VERVANYDARKLTTLLHTLETYLSCGGNIARTADQLYVRRNTLV
jgi:DNA-binding PucR family transcriptional regulator